MGVRFAKWRAVITIGEGIPSATCIGANAHALARYAALCQEAGLVPIVEPEVLMTGNHTLQRCADATVTSLLRTVPAAVPGIAFLSGGQSAELASARLNAMNLRFKARLPWVLTFSYSRAIQQSALDIWRGEPANVEQAQHALQHRAACNRAARQGQYVTAADTPTHSS